MEITQLYYCFILAVLSQGFIHVYVLDDRVSRQVKSCHESNNESVKFKVESSLKSVKV